MKLRFNHGNIVPSRQPSLRDSCRRHAKPGVQTPGYCLVVPLGQNGRLVAVREGKTIVVATLIRAERIGANKDFQLRERGKTQR